MTSAPMTYISKITELKKKELFLLDTFFSPAYALMTLSSLALVLTLSGYILYYFITVPKTQSCYTDLSIAIYVLAGLYPLECILVFVVMFSSIALSKSVCWRIVAIVFFAPIQVGLSFAGIGLIYLCLIQSQISTILPSGIFTNTLLQGVLYSTICLLIVYLIIVPILVFMHKKEVETKEKTCCEVFLCVLYYFMQFILLLSVFFVLGMLLLGPLALGYLLFEISRNISIVGFAVQETFYILALISLTFPLFIFIVTLIVTKIVQHCSCKSASESEGKSLDDSKIQTTQKNNNINLLDTSEIHHRDFLEKDNSFQMSFFDKNPDFNKTAIGNSRL